MPSHDEIQRIATAMNALRPDWKPTSLVTFLTRHHAARSYRDLAIAAIAIASDPITKTPQLLNDHGNWWVAAQVAVGGTTAASTVPQAGLPRCPIDAHHHEIAHNCRACRTEWLETGTWPESSRHHDATTRTTTPTVHVPDARSLAAGATKEDT